METKQLTKETSKQAAKPQTASRAPFCLRLNALRALACISVIMTHVVAFLDLIGKFRSFHYGGHMAVYFFFNLSGYLLSFSFIKEIRRRVNEKKEKSKSSAVSEKLTRETEKSAEKQSDQIEISVGEVKNEQENFSLIKLLKQVKKSVLVSILCKYFWNRTWRLFPLYFGCWCFLKYFAVAGIGGSLDPHLKWSDILLLRTFPGHLWTMRIEMMFYYYVIPVYICALYIAFKLQSKGLDTAAKAVFFGLAAALLYGGVLNLRIEQSELHPISHKHRLPDMLPPFYFGMLAALINFALEQKLIAKQMTKIQLPIEQEIEVENTRRVPEKLKELPKLVLALFEKHFYSLIWTAVFLRIVFLNAGVLATKKPDDTWQMANMDSYWYGIFILINDSRGGFWKLTHPNPKPQSTELHPSFLHKIIYYFGLWSYPIYLTHPISYVQLAKYFPKTKYTVEFSVITIFICMLLGGVCDFLFDKILVNKIILGKIFASRKVTPPVAKPSS